MPWEPGKETRRIAERIHAGTAREVFHQECIDQAMLAIESGEWNKHFPCDQCHNLACAAFSVDYAVSTLATQDVNGRTAESRMERYRLAMQFQAGPGNKS